MFVGTLTKPERKEAKKVNKHSFCQSYNRLRVILFCILSFREKNLKFSAAFL